MTYPANNEDKLYFSYKDKTMINKCSFILSFLILLSTTKFLMVAQIICNTVLICFNIRDFFSKLLKIFRLKPHLYFRIWNKILTIFISKLSRFIFT